MEIKEVVKKIKNQKARKFDETVDLIFAVNTGKSAETVIRLDLNIPNQFGAQKKVLVLCDKAEADGAKDADFVGLEEFVEKIKGGWMDFDVVVATPTVMPKIAILGKFLGSRGLMPNPKNGTVTKDLASAISEFKSGKVNVKTNKSGQIQIAAGKKSMTDEKLTENLEYIIKTVSGNLNNSSLKSVFIKTSMGAPYKLV